MCFIKPAVLGAWVARPFLRPPPPLSSSLPPNPVGRCCFAASARRLGFRRSCTAGPSVAAAGYCNPNQAVQELATFLGKWASHKPKDSK